MTLTVHRTGEYIRCGRDRCNNIIGIVQDNRMFVKNGDQMVIARECSIVCKCGYVNHVALRDDSTS